MNHPKPAITMLVEHHGGPTRLSRALGGQPRYQEIQRWVRRGWAAPKHLFALEALLPPGMQLRHLHEDRAARPMGAGNHPPEAA